MGYGCGSYLSQAVEGLYRLSKILACMFHFRVLPGEQVVLAECWNHCEMKLYIYTLKHAVFRVLIYLKR